MRGMSEDELAVEKGIKSNFFETHKSFALVKN